MRLIWRVARRRLRAGHGLLRVCVGVVVARRLARLHSRYEERVERAERDHGAHHPPWQDGRTKGIYISYMCGLIVQGWVVV